MPTPSRRISNGLFSSPIITLLFLFCLLSSTVQAAGAVLGVDLGTEYIKAALVKPGIPLEIVLTKDSRRKELSTVAFKPLGEVKSGEFPERFYGSDAAALAARFPGDVYPNLKTLLGLAADNSGVQTYALRYPALKLESDKTRGTAAFRSKLFVDDEQPWTIEELLAMELQSIQKNAEALAGKGSRIKDLVITIPVYFTAEEKRAVGLAADLAGLRVLELVSDGLAVGLNYAMTRQFPSVTEGEKPEHHMIFDMGAGSTKATVLKFQGRTVKDVGKFNKTIQEVQVLGSGWDRTLGGDALNAVIVDDMVAQFVQSKAAKSVSPTIEAVKAHGRAAAKMWKEAERVRQILSANANTQSSFEGLYEDVDFKYKISRVEFETLVQSYAARIGPAIQKALDMSGLDVKDLDSVILHGGAIRTPFVAKELEKIIGKGDKIRSNVNADEAAVFGAAFRGAGLSPSFRVKEIRSSEGAAYAAGMKWTNIHGKPQHQRLWQPTSFLGAEKQYTFKNQKDFSIDFFQHVPSSENVSPGSAEKELMTLTTQNLTESVARLKEKFGCTDGDINLKLSTRLSTNNGEIEIVKVNVDCEVEGSGEKAGVVDSIKGALGFGKKAQAPLSEDDDEPVEAGSSVKEESSGTSSSSTSSASAAPSDKDAKAKIAKHFEVVPVKYTAEVKGHPQLPSTEIVRMKDRLSAFEDSDRSRRLRDEALNQLEGFTYTARDLLDKADFISSSTKEERESLGSKREAAGEWIYSEEGKHATRDELKAKLKEMKDIVSPIQNRMDEAAARPEQIKTLQQGLDETKQLIEGVEKQIKAEQKANEDWSSSKSASPASSTPSPASKAEDDFEGLVDDEPTTTASAIVEEDTPPPIAYKAEDLVPLQLMYDEASIWLDARISEQNKLPATADPVLLIKDMEHRTKNLQDARVNLVLKAMKVEMPPKPKKKPASKKSKTSKTKKSKSASKTGSAEKGEQTLDFDGNGKPVFNFDPDGEMPTEEQILSFIRKNKGEEAAKEASEDIEKEKEEKPHDEL